MKFLGIDYGAKRIGIAVSDEGGTLAFPREIVLNNKSTLEEILKIMKEENISEIVIGESLNLKGEENKIAGEIKKFILELEKASSLPIHTEKEFLTSVEARNSQNTKQSLHIEQAHGKNKKNASPKIDASAAALILQRYLDRLNR
ncbi:MAG: Holliday junction resolvase RuvX [Patescibacteria group bacterium]